MRNYWGTVLAVAAVCSLVSGCQKKVAAKAPAAPVVQSAKAAPEPENRASRPAPAPSAYKPAAASNMPDAATRARIQDLLNRIQDAYFDYNKHTLRPDAEAALKTDATTLGEILRQYPDYKLTVEGHCDERGSDEYNLALGAARAKQAQEYLATFGVPSGQLATISYGKERPICADHDEACWQKNRRAHISQAEN
jgi:peptidoglycan-associated lipoprotein